MSQSNAMVFRYSINYFSRILIDVYFNLFTKYFVLKSLKMVLIFIYAFLQSLAIFFIKECFCYFLEIIFEQAKDKFLSSTESNFIAGKF